MSDHQGTPVSTAARRLVSAAAAPASPLDCPTNRWAARRRFGPRRRGNALEPRLRLALPTRPPRGSKGRHRRRCTLPVPRMPATPQPPPGGSADRRRSCWFGGCTASVTGPLRPFLPSCKRVECTAVRLLRQGLAARRAPAGPPPSSGCQRGQDGVSGGPRCWRTMVAGPGRAGGQALYTRAGRGAGVGWRAARGQRAPPPLAGRCAPV